MCRYDIRTYVPSRTPSHTPIEEPVSIGQAGQPVTDPSFNILYTFQYYTPDSAAAASPTTAASPTIAPTATAPTIEPTNPPTDPPVP